MKKIIKAQKIEANDVKWRNALTVKANKGKMKEIEKNGEMHKKLRVFLNRHTSAF